VVNGLHFLDELACSGSGSEHGVDSQRTSPADSSVSLDAHVFSSEPFSMSFGIPQTLSKLHLMDSFTTLLLLELSSKSINFSFLLSSSFSGVLLSSIGLLVDTFIGCRSSHSLLYGLYILSRCNRGCSLLGRSRSGVFSRIL